MKYLLTTIISTVVFVTGFKQADNAAFWAKWFFAPGHIKVAIGEMHQRSIVERLVGMAKTPDQAATIRRDFSRLSNKRVQEYLNTINQGQEDDSFPYCSAFVVWCLKEAHAKDTYPHNAFFIPWIEQASGAPPELGDVVLMAIKENDGSVTNHIAFFWGYANDGNIQILGGNQGYEVSIVERPPNEVIGYVKVRY